MARYLISGRGRFAARPFGVSRDVIGTFPHTLPKSAGSPPLTRFQNRACAFPFTRLLSCVVRVKNTGDRLIFDGLDVMTMSMEELEVGGFVITST